jgi:hypothetical protein
MSHSAADDALIFPVHARAHSILVLPTSYLVDLIPYIYACPY